MSTKDCPKCGESVQRAHRKLLDRLISALVKVHRYACNGCGWSGLWRA